MTLGLVMPFFRYKSKRKIHEKKKELISFTSLKLKIFCLSKRMKRKATDMGENIGKTYYDKGLSSKIYKELLKTNNKKQKSDLKMDTLPERYIDGK